MTLNRFLILLLPEITLTVVAFLIFILDLIIGGDEVRERRLQWFAFLGVLLAQCSWREADGSQTPVGDRHLSAILGGKLPEVMAIIAGQVGFGFVLVIPCK